MKSPEPSTQKEIKEVLAVDGMNFIDALKVVQMGGKVHKQEWEDQAFYLEINQGKLQLHKPDGKFYDFILSEVDMDGQDYIQLFTTN